MAEGRPTPFYQVVDGFKIPGMFLADSFRDTVNFKPKPGDLFVATFPKCGTTWTQQIVSLILNRGISASSLMEFMQKNPYLELAGVETTEATPRPGLLKVHLPYHLTPFSEDAKYIYVVRNPKDTLVSFYHHTTSFFYRFKNGSFDDYFEIFLAGENDYGDYFDHVLGWYEHRNDPNVLFLTYEEMKQDIAKAVMKLSRFMGDEYAQMLEDEPEVLSNVLKYSSLEHMKFLNETEENIASMDFSHLSENQVPKGLKHIVEQLKKDKNEETEKFQLVRKGIVGGWRKCFSEDQNNRIDEKIEKKLKGTELYTFWKELNCI